MAVITSSKSNFKEVLKRNFKFKPTPSQENLFEVANYFMLDEGDRTVMILKGYAGTGKTTFLSTFIKTIPKLDFKCVLLAPTGRAAKVMTSLSGRKSQTIHRKIYLQKEDSRYGSLLFELQKNTHTDTVFIIDEASMISDSREFGNNGLLNDLMSYVFSGSGNKLVLMGDVAQLPPVNTPLSPALDEHHVEGNYQAKVYSITLKDVMRQGETSGILSNATALRKELENTKPNIQLATTNYKDIYKMSSEKIEDGLRYAYDKYGKENTIVITRSNKNAVAYNRLIRNNINFTDAELDVSDMVMVVKNNYSILDDTSEAGFIANGEFAEVKRLGREEEMHGLRFQQVTLQLIDYPDEPPFETLVILDTLYSNSPNLNQDQNKEFYDSVLKDYAWASSKREQKKLMKEDKYLNALQIKFAYALTCHKAQGGQWDAVFIDQIYMPTPEIDHDLIRWLYTAVTRGVKEVFFINFQSYLFAS